MLLYQSHLFTCGHCMQLFNARLVNGVNPLLDDTSMGGGSDAVGGHALVLALHVQKQLNSSSKLVQMLKDDGSTLVKTINCVKPLQSLIQVIAYACHISKYIAH